MFVNEDGDFLDDEGFWINPRWACCKCTKIDCNGNPVSPVKFAEERYAFGIYAGKYCDKCWDESGYKKEGAEGFDETYAGERYWDDY